ncbi:MAG: putative sulfate/molybdate transporter [Rhodanobacter thiooxydans]|nr:putative sulfate/molybdate transporter [Rhodanobacter thiooxydans]
MADQPSPASAVTRRALNRYDRLEWAGAFGDLGTLMPFVIAYVSIMKLDAFGVLFGFGLSMAVCGWVYKTPFPVQPMKAAGAVATTQAAQSAVITPGAVYGAGLVTGLIWLVLGMTGLAERLTRWISRPVAQGVVLGLGMAFMWQGARLMANEWLLAGVGLLAKSRRVPGIFVLLLLGIAWTAVQQPDLLHTLLEVRPVLRWPTWAWPTIGWNDIVLGTLFLALPQVPLTLGNAIIGVREENNRLFPDRPVTDRQVAVSTGVMNVFGSAVGGVPMCHGAGGMAGHVAFGARTGGSLVILGGLLLVLAIGFSASVVALFEVIPQAVLGTILFMTGVQLAGGQFDQARQAHESTVLLVTAGLSMWNVGIGLLLQILLLRKSSHV